MRVSHNVLLEQNRLSLHSARDRLVSLHVRASANPPEFVSRASSNAAQPAATASVNQSAPVAQGDRGSSPASRLAAQQLGRSALVVAAAAGANSAAAAGASRDASAVMAAPQSLDGSSGPSAPQFEMR